MSLERERDSFWRPVGRKDREGSRGEGQMRWWLGVAVS